MKKFGRPTRRITSKCPRESRGLHVWWMYAHSRDWKWASAYCIRCQATSYGTADMYAAQRQKLDAPWEPDESVHNTPSPR